ncbi:hypothetical protein ACFYXF_51220 [Streptomyces sp. NPDC002680]|uniref:hypothetical protein n=1 Tax=Streptomyces sp. NPDC002680 TaxID=3364659 RepID=UPI0036CCB778
MSGGELSGVDLARAAMEAARRNGSGQKQKSQQVRTVRRGGVSRWGSVPRSAPW